MLLGLLYCIILHFHGDIADDGQAQRRDDDQIRIGPAVIPETWIVMREFSDGI
jgi:hypothetical protein